jgi:hypothetical protein
MKDLKLKQKLIEIIINILTINNFLIYFKFYVIITIEIKIKGDFEYVYGYESFS